MLGLRCCVGFSLVAASGGGCSPAVVCRRPIVLAFHGRARAIECLASAVWHTGLVLCGMWDLARSGTEPVSLALAGGCFTTKPPGKPNQGCLSTRLHTVFGKVANVSSSIFKNLIYMEREFMIPFCEAC